jgi:hypothetical protein
MNYFGDFIIPCYNNGDDDFDYRLRNIKLICELLPYNMNIIVVEQISDETRTSYIDELENTKFFRDDINYIKKYYDKGFVKGWLYNAGYRHSKTENLFLGESDVVFSPNYWDSIYKQLQSTSHPWAHCWNILYQMNNDHVSIVRKVIPKPGGPEGGIVFFNKEFYESIGGSNEWMLGLGGMDNEIINRCAYKSKSRIKLKGEIFHLWHPFSILKGTTDKEVELSENGFKSNRQRNGQIAHYIKNKTGLVINEMCKYIELIGSNVPLCDIVELFDKNGTIKGTSVTISTEPCGENDIEIRLIEPSDENIENIEINTNEENRKIKKIHTSNNSNLQNKLYRNIDASRTKRIQKKIIKNPAVKFTM